MSIENHGSSKIIMAFSRRKFIAGMSAIGAAIPFASSYSVGSLVKKRFSISFFTKPLDGYDLDFMLETLSMAGVEGLDLTVRSKGRVEPEKIATDLPKVIEVARKNKLNTEMMVTGIVEVGDPQTEEILRVASAEGITHYRMGYYNYDSKGEIIESLKENKKKLIKLAELNKKYNIQAGYQNHSGAMVGSPVWDIKELLEGLPVEYASSQFDVRHAVTEGSSSWILGLRLLSKNIGSLVLKDFTWDVKDNKARVINVPLGEGIVDFDLYFSTIKELGIVAPISLHIEYPLLKKENQNLTLLKKQELIAATIKKDVNFIRMNLQKFQLV